MINTEPNKDHQYILRSCLNCNLLSSCIANNLHKDEKKHCDFGKYGCFEYQGIYENEKSKNELGINIEEDDKE